MIHHSSPSFWSAYNALPVSVQKVADQNYELLKDNPKHRSQKDVPEDTRVPITYVSHLTESDMRIMYIMLSRAYVLGCGT